MRHATGVRLRSKGEKEEEETQRHSSLARSPRVLWRGGMLEWRVWRARVLLLLLLE
jgi:hypothetical protein